MGLVARHLEAAGIPTLSMTSAIDITRSVNPPRAAFVDFPLGHTTGRPHDAEMQRELLRAALRAFEEIRVPGTVEMLPFRWSEDERWKDEAFTGHDERKPRLDTPQYQSDADRLLAEACVSCSTGPR